MARAPASDIIWSYGIRSLFWYRIVSPTCLPVGVIHRIQYIPLPIQALEIFLPYCFKVSRN